MSGISLKYVEIRNNDVWARGSNGWRQLEDWLPNSITDFEVFYYLGIGPSDSEETSEFHFIVVSKSNYERMSQEDRKDLRRRWKYFIVDQYEWATVLAEITRRISNSDTGSWSDSLEKLRQQFSWEFENYNKPSPPEVH